jgi:putative flippase GtrA
MSAQANFDKVIQLYRFHQKSFITFLTVGIGTTTVYLCLFAFLWKFLHLHHLIAVTIAFLASATFQFFTNRKVTFKIKSQQLLPQLVKYSILLITNYLISIGVLQLVIWAGGPLFLGLILGIGLTSIIGYLVFKYWVFQPEAFNLENTN